MCVRLPIDLTAHMKAAPLPMRPPPGQPRGGAWQPGLAQHQAQQQAAQVEMQRDQAQSQASLQLETTKSESKLKHLQEEVRLKKELMAYEFELNQKIRNQESIEKRDSEKRKEEGLDKREVMKQTN